MTGILRGMFFCSGSCVPELLYVIMYKTAQILAQRGMGGGGREKSPDGADNNSCLTIENVKYFKTPLAGIFPEDTRKKRKSTKTK